METEILQKKEIKWVPKLRFGEFNTEWKKNDINKLSSKLKVGFVGTCEPFYTNSIEGVLLIRTGNLKGVRIELDIEKYVTKEFHEKNKKSQIYPGDLLLARHGGNGEICRVPVGFPIANCLNIVILRTNSELDSEYFQFAYSSLAVQKQISSVTAGSTQGVINTGEIGKLKIIFPSLSEQQKIASFLSAVDKKIQQLTRKKELLETYKKGVMQQLFSQEIRFKNENGKDFPDWEEKKLGKVGKIVSGLTYSPNDIVENGTLVLRSSNIQDKKLDFNDNVYVKVDSFNPVQENDILICVRNGSKRLIGKNAIINKDNQGLAFGAFMTVYRSKYNLFLFHFFDSAYYKKEVHKNLGATINSINGGDLKKFKIPFPDKKEQQKIADFLAAIDRKIETVQQQITKTESFKKGLLQQMFV